MIPRCHFPDHTGDPAVFGQCRECFPEPESVHAETLQAELDRLERRPAGYDGPPDAWEEVGPLVPSWRFVVPEERPYETTLSDSDGDLG